jgi:hypothetical protein
VDQQLTERNADDDDIGDGSESEEEEIFEDSMDFNPVVGGEPLLDSSDHSTSDLSRDEQPVSSPSLSR